MGGVLLLFYYNTGGILGQCPFSHMSIFPQLLHAVVCGIERRDISFTD
jgi:hypothetical protein